MSDEQDEGSVEPQPEVETNETSADGRGRDAERPAQAGNVLPAPGVAGSTRARRGRTRRTDPGSAPTGDRPAIDGPTDSPAPTDGPPLGPPGRRTAPPHEQAAPVAHDPSRTGAEPEPDAATTDRDASSVEAADAGRPGGVGDRPAGRPADSRGEGRTADTTAASEPPAGSSTNWPAADARTAAEPAGRTDAWSAAQADTRADASTDAEPDSRTDAWTGAQADTRADASADGGPDPRTGGRAEIQVDAPTDPWTDTWTGAQADSRTDAQADTRADARTDPWTDTRTAAEADSRTDAQADARPEARTDARADARADAATAAATAARPGGEADGEAEVEGAGGDLDGDADAAVGVAGSGKAAGRRRLRWASASRAAALIGVLCGLLGFGLAVQVRSNTASNGLAAARQEDLVRILDDLSSREERLRRQIASLEAARTRLTTTGDKNSAALTEARSRSTSLGILAGTLAAQGPGVQLTMSDPLHKLKAEDLLDAVEELRAAGAEAVQVGPVRIGLNSSFTDADDAGGRILADGNQLTAPYQIVAIGDPATLATALNIPGGVVDTVRQAGGRATIVQQQRLVIRALRSLSTPHYAQPAE